MPKRTGLFFMIDGIAGSGKTTVIEAVRKHLSDEGLSTFNLHDWFTENNTPPTYKEAAAHDVLFTFEPTRAWIGSAIRYELSRTDNPYSAKQLAQAFALDRHLMYKRLIVPALKDGKIIIQDRGVSTSIVYQPVMDDTIDLSEVLELEGNAFVLNWAPDHLIITDIPAEVAHKRLGGRDEESRGVFAELDALRKWNTRFHSDWLQNLFMKHGTKLHTINTGKTKKQSVKQAEELITSLIDTKPQ